MTAAHAVSILQVGAVVLLGLGSGLVLHVLRMAEHEGAASPGRPEPPALPEPAVAEPLRRAA